MGYISGDLENKINIYFLYFARYSSDGEGSNGKKSLYTSVFQQLVWKYTIWSEFVDNCNYPIVAQLIYTTDIP